MVTTKRDKIIIREATASDIPMMQTFIFDHGKNPWNFLPEKETKAHIAEISNQKVRAYLAETNGECVGFACFHLDLPPHCKKYEENQTNKVAYLSEIVVHRRYTGQGIGSKLINALKEYLVTQSVTQLYAERNANNIGSAKLMTNTGFKIIDEYDDELRRSTTSRKTVVTRLELN